MSKARRIKKARRKYELLLWYAMKMRVSAVAAFAAARTMKDTAGALAEIGLSEALRIGAEGQIARRATR